MSGPRSGGGGETLASALASKVEVMGGQDVGPKSPMKESTRKEVPDRGETHVGTCMCKGHKSCAWDSWHWCSYLVCKEGISNLSYSGTMIM